MKLLHRMLSRRMSGCHWLVEADGGSLVETAVVMPILLLTVTGVLSLGITVNSAIELTNGVAMGAQLMAEARGDASITDPCASAAAMIKSVAPLPASNTITYTFQIYTSSTASTTYGPSTAPTCTAGAAQLTQGKNIVVTATAPCVVSVYGNGNILPGCELPAKMTVVSQ